MNYLSNRLLGTPDEEEWPGVTQLPDYKSSFPQWKSKDLKSNVTGLTDTSTDLLQVNWTYLVFALHQACLSLSLSYVTAHARL